MNPYEALALLIADLYQQVRTLQQENDQLKVEAVDKKAKK